MREENNKEEEEGVDRDSRVEDRGRKWNDCMTDVVNSNLSLRCRRDVIKFLLCFRFLPPDEIRQDIEDAVSRMKPWCVWKKVTVHLLTVTSHSELSIMV